jgi:hypothetical protein
MLYRVLTACLIAVATGCSGPSIELLDARLAPSKNAANGKMMQEVLTTCKNNGNLPVRLVDAEIKSLNADGGVLETYNYIFYSAFNDSPGVLPGETYTTEARRGFQLPGFDGLPGYPAPSVKVRITRVAEKSVM